jgi:hypothetical protein
VLQELIGLVPLALIVIALMLACAVRAACRGAARSLSSRAAAGDPFLFPHGDTLSEADQAIANYRRELREDDFRAFGLPPTRRSFGRRGANVIPFPGAMR